MLTAEGSLGDILDSDVSIGPAYHYGETGAEFALTGNRLDLELAFEVSGRL